MKLVPEIASAPLGELNLSKFNVIALPFTKRDKLVELANPKLIKLLTKHFQSDIAKIFEDWPDVTGKAGELIEVPLVNQADKTIRLYFIGTGAQSVDDLRKAASSLARKVKGAKVKVLDGLVTEKSAARAHLISLILSSYIWSQKSAPVKEFGTAQFTIIGNFESEVASAKVIALAVWRARDLIHTPSNIKNPQWIAEQARSLVTKTKSPALKLEVKGGAALAKFGGLLAVGNSAPKPGPRLVQLSYAPKGSKNWPHVVLVGKGITFDTGGVSLKRPYESMVGMKSDMSGAAAVLATVIAIAEMGKSAPKVRVTGLLMCAENALSSTAQRPSDVITQYGGKTVEVINTDAEGRLVLADGLAYAD